jgi:hypothetical protein
MRTLLLSVFLFLTAIAHAQVVDDFSDSNFTAAPVWSGDDSLFIINSNKELQSNGPQATSTLYLSTPNILIDSVEWNFLVKLAFNPSSTNYVRVYLVSDNADLEGSLNGYFVQLGEAGIAPDSIDIFRQDGSALTNVFTGTSGCLSSSSGDNVRIKITRDNAGNWNVYADCTGGTNYNLEGQFADNNFTTTACFGFYCRYSTVSRYNMFYFDDISIAAISIIGDTVKPTVQTVNIISPTQLDVKFSEGVNTVTAESISNYNIDNSIGNPLNAQLDGVDNSLVHLTLSSPLASGTPYNITMQNVDDLAGNVMLPATLPMFYFTPAQGDIVINEIFADFSPQVNLPNGEFVELKNNKSFAVNLSGWTFSDATITVTLPNVSIPADSFIVLCATTLVDSFAARGFNNIIVAGLSSLPSLNNTSDSLTLKDNNGNVIDRVNYFDSWYRDAVKQAGGWALERIDANTTCGEAENWIASININGGTPGANNSVGGMIFDTIKPAIIAYEVFSANSVKITLSENIDSTQLLAIANYSLNNGLGNPQSISILGLDVILTFSSNLDSSLVYFLTVQNLSDCSGNTMLIASLQIIFYTPSVGDIVINEIFADQSQQVNLPSGEFIELKNNKNIPVNLNGWTFSDASITVTILNVIIPADSFIVLCANSLVDSFAARGFNNIIIKEISLPSLNNDNDSLTLRDYNGNIIDYVNYSDAWYGDVVKQDGGWTLERIDPNTSCGEGLNWTASLDLNGGTPGTRNSVQGIFSDTTKPFIVSYEIIDSVTLKIIISESVDSVQATFVANYNLNNSIGNPQSVSVSGLEAVLIFGSALDSSLTYQLTAQNIFDCIGNVISSSPIIISFPSKANVYDVLITEIYADPEPSYGMPNAEYVELFNRSDRTISLKDWTFSDATSTATLPDKILLQGDYIIVCANSNASLFTPFGNVAAVSSLPSLNNDSDELTLKDVFGRTIHYVNYSSDWHGDVIKKDGGFSLELIDTENPCTGAGNWKASEAIIGGTPGTENSVNGANPDNVAPSLLYVLVSDSQHITLVFDESLDSLNITNPNQFSITPNNVAVTSFTTVAPSFTEIQLTLNNPLQPKIIYTITVSNITDCSGNIIAENTARFGLPEFPNSGDVIINEILFNPESFGSDFVELYNASDKIIDLKSLIIAEADYVKRDSVTEFTRASSRGFLLLPQQYVALTPDANYIRSRYFSENPKNILLLGSLPSYPDDGVVMLKDTLLNTFDKVAYSEDWHYPLVDDKNGVSLERIQFNAASQDKNNWHSAASTVGYATPAYKNSQYKDAAEVKEYFIISPEAFSPDNDGYNDFLNIIYQFDEPGWAANIKIFDSGGRPIRDLLKNELLATEGTLQWDGITDEGKKARIGIHIIYIELFNPDGDVKKYKKSCVVAGKIE